MTTSSFLGLLVLGALVGAFYAYSQWRTVQRIHQVRNAKMYMFWMTLVRLAIFFSILFWVAAPNGSVAKVLTFFAGFMATRFISVKKIKNSLTKSTDNLQDK